MNNRINAKDSIQRKLIVSSLMSAITIILYLFSNVPILNFAGVLLCAVPLTLVSFVYGFNFGILSISVSLILVTIILGPLQAYFYLSVFGILSIITGVMTRILLEPMRISIYSVILILIFNLFFYYGVERLFGLEDMIKDFKIMCMKVVNWIFGIIPFISVNYKKYFIQYINILIKVPIMLFFLVSFAMFYLNFFASGFIFKRFKIPFPEIPPIPLWKIPKELSFIFVFSLIMSILLKSYKYKWIFYTFINLFSISYISLFFLGYSFIAYMFAIKRVNPIIRLFMLPFLIIFNFAPVFIAIGDSFKNWRNLKSFNLL